jgi:hypothetical protein
MPEDNVGTSGARDLVKEFEACTLPAEAFHHHDHIFVAWTYLRRMDYVAAEKRISEGIRKYAEHHGDTSKYQHTLTVVWMRLVAAAIRQNPGIDEFESFAALNPKLFERTAPQAFYSPCLLQSEAARRGWVELDLTRLRD